MGTTSLSMVLGMPTTVTGSLWPSRRRDLGGLRVRVVAADRVEDGHLSIISCSAALCKGLSPSTTKSALDAVFDVRQLDARVADGRTTM